MLKKEKEYTYKQICENLNLPQKTGNAKIKQLSELSKYYNYTNLNFQINQV